MPVSDIWEVLRRPLITEKGTALAAEGKFLFEVHPDCTKAQVKQAIERAFKVNVVAVNIAVMPGKSRRWKRWTAYQSDWKKAVVTLKSGERIELFDA